MTKWTLRQSGLHLVPVALAAAVLVACGGDSPPAQRHVLPDRPRTSSRRAPRFPTPPVLLPRPATSSRAAVSPSDAAATPIRTTATAATPPDPPPATRTTTAALHPDTEPPPPNHRATPPDAAATPPHHTATHLGATTSPPSTAHATDTALTPGAAATPSPVASPTGITILGSDAFVSQVEAALQLLSERAPEALASVEDGIATIRSVSSGSGMDVYSKTYLVGDVTAYAPGFGRRQQVIWLAGTVVHDACHSNLYAKGEVFRGKAAEVTCLERQLEALDLIDDGSFFSNYIEELIEGADDPEHQYWNDPNRHW